MSRLSDLNKSMTELQADERISFVSNVGREVDSLESAFKKLVRNFNKFSRSGNKKFKQPVLDDVQAVKNGLDFFVTEFNKEIKLNESKRSLVENPDSLYNLFVRRNNKWQLVNKNPQHVFDLEDLKASLKRGPLKVNPKDLKILSVGKKP